MANTEVLINIKANDQTSQAFKQAADGASRMGDAVTKGAQEADKGLENVEKSAKEAGKSLEEMEKKATAIGAGIGVLGTSLAYLGNAFKEQERLTDGITRAYGDSADEMLAFADNIQETTRFSNDAAQAALLLGNSLSQNYGFAAEDMELLLQRSADLAQIYGISLPDAMQRTAAAMRGEGESAEALGLNLSDAAIAAAALDAGITNWNVPGALTESEKAAFRFQVFMEQSAFATGAAADAANNAGGAFKQFANTLQDGVQAAGGFLGPIGEIAAEFAPMALLLPVIGGGLGKLTSAFGAASTSAGLLAAATNPVVLSIVAATAAVGAGVFAWQKYQEYINQLPDAFKDLDSAYNEFLLNGDSARAEAIAGFQAELEALEQQLNELAGGGQNGPKFPLPSESLYADFIASITAGLTDARVDIGEFGTYIEAQFARIAAAPDQAGAIMQETIDKINGGLGDFALEAGETATAVTAAFSSMQSVIDTLDSTALTAMFEGNTEALSGLNTFVGQLGATYIPIIDKATGATVAYQTVVGQIASEDLPAVTMATDILAAALVDGEHDAAAINAELARIATLPTPEEQTQAYIDLGIEINTTDKYAAELNTTLSSLGSAFGNVGASVIETAAAQAELNAEMQAGQQAITDYIASGEDFYEVLDGFVRSTLLIGALGDTTASALRQSTLETIAFVEGLSQVSAELDAMLYYFGRIDELGQRSSSAGSVAENLVGTPGEWAIVDDLLASGAISLEQYNATLEAGYGIQESNLRVQEDLNVIRAAQLPLLAEQQTAYEAYIAQLSEMTPAEQQRALALADTAYQTEVSRIAALAYSGAIGEIPKEAATKMIVDAANADPVLKSLLLDLGLITETDGEISVNFPNAESVQSALADINDTLYAIADLLDGGGLDGSVDITYTEDKSGLSPETEAALNGESPETAPIKVPVAPNDGIGPLLAGYQQNPPVVEVEVRTISRDFGDSVKDFANSGGGQTVTITTELIDNASDRLREVSQLAQDLDGTTSTLTALAEISPAMQGFDEVRGSHRDLDGDSVTMVVQGNISDAMQDFADVDRRHGSLDGNSSTMFVKGDASSATSAINKISAYDGDVLATSYYDVVTRYYSTGSAAGRGPNRHGGVAGYAHGGVISELAEAGPEIVHFATGGTAMAATRGLYNLSPGDYVSSAPASRGSGQAPSVNIYFTGTVIGVQDLYDEVTENIAPALVEVLNDHRAGLGYTNG